MEMKKLLISFLTIAMLCSVASADFLEDLQTLASENAEDYLSPFVTSFGTNMNNGLYHTAKPHKLFGFDVGIRMMGAMTPDDAMTYTFAFPQNVPIVNPMSGGTLLVPTSTLYPDPALFEAPTVFGGEGHAIAPDINALEQVLFDSLGIPLGTFSPTQLQQMADQSTFEVPPGLDLEVAPLVMPQFSMGLPFESEVLLRYMPEIDLNDYGKVTFWGLGLKHSISQYLPMVPVDISAQFVMQQLKIGDILESKHTAFNVHASKKLSMVLLSITPYVGLGMESSDLSVDYTIEGTGNPLLDGVPVKFDLDGDNGFRGRIGFSTRLLLFKLYADYSFIGDYSGYSAGLMLSFF